MGEAFPMEDVLIDMLLKVPGILLACLGVVFLTMLSPLQHAERGESAQQRSAFFNLAKVTQHF